jgi:hypothetical protein
VPAGLETSVIPFNGPSKQSRRGDPYSTT